MTTNRSNRVHMEEAIVQNNLVKALRSVYDNRRDNKSSIVQEYYVGSNEDNYYIDVVIETRNIAIECKNGDIKNIKSGIGQSVRYEIDGWSSYLCIPSIAVNKDIIDMCLQSGIGLIGVTDKDIANGKKINVEVQNEMIIKCTETGYIRNNNGIDVPKVLDNLGVDTIEDIVHINDKLSELKLNTTDDDRWRNIKERRDIFPENS